MKTMILSCIAIALAMFFTVGQLPQVDDKVYGYGYYDDVLKYDVDGKDNFVILWDTNYDYEYIYTDAPYGTEIETVIMGSKYYTYIDTSGVEIGYDPIYLSAVTFEGYWIEIEIYDYYGYNSYPLSPPATSQAPPFATDPSPSMTVTTPCYTTSTPVTTTNIPASTTTTWRPPSHGDPNDDPPASTTVTKATTYNTSVSMSGGATTSVPSDSITSSETTSKYYPILDNMAVGSIKVCNQYGDLNDDNMVDLTDLTILSLYLLHDCELNDAELYAANVQQGELNEDDEPNLADLAKLKQYVLKQDVILGPEDIINADLIYR